MPWILQEAKTKQYAKALGSLGMDNSLVIIGEAGANVALASRNHAKSKLLDVKGLNVSGHAQIRGTVIDLKVESIRG